MNGRNIGKTRRRQAMALAETMRQSPFAREPTVDVSGPDHARLLAAARRPLPPTMPPPVPRGAEAKTRAQRVGKYEVMRRIARGRITEILLARTEGIGGVERQVVIKLLRLQLAHGGRFVRSFLHEERVTSALSHPNVVQLLDSGHDECGYYMALEYIRGWDVSEVLRAAARAGQRVPLSVAVSIVHGAAAGLHYLHELVRSGGEQPRVSHRDIQPSNIMIGEAGAIKLIDFGDVAIEGMEREKLAILSTVSSYTPPEAVGGDASDRRGDIYSLGAVFYELTTGVAPQLIHRGGHGGASEVVSPSSICSDYVPEVEDLVMRMLQPEPERRLQSMATVQFALEELAARYRFSLLPRHVAQYAKGLIEDREQQPAARILAAQARAAMERGDAAGKRRFNDDDDDDLGKTRIRVRSPRPTPQ